MSPEEAQRLLNLFDPDGTITTHQMAERMFDHPKEWEKEHNRKAAWNKLNKMASDGLVSRKRVLGKSNKWVRMDV